MTEKCEDHLKKLEDHNRFLNLLLDNINAAVLLADEHLNIYRANRSFLSQFGDPERTIAGGPFGKATGCIHSVEEQVACGETSWCDACAIRDAVSRTLFRKEATDRLRLRKSFHIQGHTREKIFEITTRPLTFQGRPMALAIFYDITEIETQRIELEQKNIQIEKDLDAAAGIQKSLLPDNFPDFPNLEFAWRFVPCSKIGGDIFNMIYIDDSTLAVYMIDVCGHGVSAAFLAVAVSQFLRNRDLFLAGKIGLVSPRKVLRRLSRTFTFERFDSFFTIFYAIIDTRERTFTYSCGGHPPAVRVGVHGGLKELGGCGPAIGFEYDTRFEQHTLGLEDGDTIFLFTDGIYESESPAGERFGLNRLHRVLSESPGKTVREIVDRAFGAADRHAAGSDPEDDISILGVNFRR
mgnify:FL=1